MPVQKQLFDREPVFALAFFRIGFGAIMAMEIFFKVSSGQFSRFYQEPSWFFSYPGFSWIKPFDPVAFSVFYFLLGICGVLVSIGLLFRIASVFLFLGYTYIFLIDQSLYQNHHYLFCWCAFLLMLSPANLAYSVDHRVGVTKHFTLVYRYHRFVFCLLVAFVYFFAGLAKIERDWITGVPLAIFLTGRFPSLSDGLVETLSVVMANLGLAIDITAPFFLAFRRSRILIFVILVCFHGLNSMLFEIGFFPIFSVLLLTLFIGADWPEKVLNRTFTGRSSCISAPVGDISRIGRRGVTFCIFLFISVHIAVPLRPFFYPGNASWTGEGERFSWRMMLSVKKSRVQINAFDRDGNKPIPIDPNLIFTPWQLAVAGVTPQLIPELAERVSTYLEETRRVSNVGVKVDLEMSLNGRPYRRLVSPDVDFADVKGGKLFESSTWINRE